MAENTTQLRMMSGLANLASIEDYDFVELVWENGQILMQGLPRRTQKSSSCISYSSNSYTGQVENEGNAYALRTAGLGILNPMLAELGNHDDHHHKLLPFQTDDNVFSENEKSNNDNKHLTDSHIVPVYEHADLETRCKSKFIEEINPSSTQQHKCAWQHCQASDPFKRLGMSSSQTVGSMGGLANSKLQVKQDSGPDRQLESGNFNFLKPAALVKANNQSIGMSKPSSSPVLSKGEKSKRDIKRPEMMTGAACKSKGGKALHNQPNSMPTNVEKSEAVGHTYAASTNKRIPEQQVHGQTSSLAANIAKTKFDAGKSTEPPMASSSVCSRIASSNPASTLKRSYDYDYDYDYEGTEGSASPSENADQEEPEGVTRAVPARGKTGSKRNRQAEVHSLSERRRRDKINKKMRALQELIPNCNKVDKASMLDEAIQYLKTLQLQLQVMSMRSGLCMPQMMIPMGMQQLHAPYMPHFSPMAVAMAIGCTPPHMLPPILPFFGGASSPLSIPLPAVPAPTIPQSTSNVPILNNKLTNSEQLKR